MIEQLKQIQARFNKASKSYDDVAWVQKDAAEFLVAQLVQDHNFMPHTVLDVGSGTGYIPELLLEKFPQSAFYLNDIAAEMLKVCKAKFAKANNILKCAPILNQKCLIMVDSITYNSTYKNQTFV